MHEDPEAPELTWDLVQHDGERRDEPGCGSGQKRCGDNDAVDSVVQQVANDVECHNRMTCWWRRRSPMVCQPPEAAIEQPESGDTRCYAYGNEPTTRTARQRVRDELEHCAADHGTRSEAREHWHPREHTSLVEAEC